MKRRRFLWAGAAAAAAASGCVDRLPEEDAGDDGNRSDPGGEGGESSDDVEDGDDASTGVRLLSSEFDVTDRVPGNAEDVADVYFDTGEEAVEVGGVIQGSNSCETAELDTVGYDDEVDVLEVRVETADLPDAAEVCTPVIMEVSYHVVAELSGGLPSTVSVYHDGELLVSVERTSGN